MAGVGCQRRPSKAASPSSPIAVANFPARMRRRLPSVSDWLSRIRPEAWMSRRYSMPKGSSPEADSS